MNCTDLHQCLCTEEAVVWGHLWIYWLVKCVLLCVRVCVYVYQKSKTMSLREAKKGRLNKLVGHLSISTCTIICIF